jgi:hypothetical protein
LSEQVLTLDKVYLPAIAGRVPDEMVKAVSAYLEFCYLVRRDVITEDTLVAIDQAVECFHCLREIFRETGVRNNFNLPRQHSVTHYRQLIQMFGAPNGVCSSITESRHIKAVKKPWRRSNHNNAIGQMLVTNQRIDKLAASRVHFASCGLLRASVLPERYRPEAPPVTRDEDEDERAVDGPTILGKTKLAKCSGEQ